MSDPQERPLQLSVRRSTLRRSAAILLVAAAIVAGSYGIAQLVRRDPFGGSVAQRRWQAVYLTNDRVYFGHLRAGGGDFYELRDAYFIEDATVGEGDEAKQAQRVQPVTKQVTGPDGRLFIRRREVRMFENLRPDSPVVKAIADVRGASGR